MKNNIVTASTGIASEKKLRRILMDHSRRYPEWQIDDLYKLIYQAAKGCEHAVRDAESARAWLEKEMKGLASGITEPLVDVISPDSKIARIHLRPFMAAGYDSQILLDAFLQTAGKFTGSPNTLIQYGQHIAQLAANEKFSFTSDEVIKFFRSMEELNYPALHHSSVFNARYFPAYRVVAIQYLPKNIIRIS